MAKKSRITLVLPAGVASFPSLDKPDAGPPVKAGAIANKPKFKVKTIMDPSADFAELDAKIKEAVLQEWGPKAKVSSVKSCLKDGDAENVKREDKGKDAIEGWVGKKFIDAGSQFAVDVVDAKKNKIAPETVQGGDIIRVMIQLIPCEPSGTRTIGVRLLAVQLIEKRATGEGWGNEFGETDGFVAGDKAAAKSGADEDEDGDSDDADF